MRKKKLMSMIADRDNELQKLRCRVKELKRDNQALEELLDDRETKLVEIKGRINGIPEECKPGAYCRGCAFAKEYVMYSEHGFGRLISMYLCNKNGGCASFVKISEDE